MRIVDAMATAAPQADVGEAEPGADLLHRLLGGAAVSARPAASMPGVIVGELIAIADEGQTPLVIYPGQPGTAALRARSVLDLHGSHIGRPVVLAFEGGDAQRPIVLGVMSPRDSSSLIAMQGQVEVDSDGLRLLVTAKEQLVLRCGKASITLTKAGKVLIEGAYLSSRSTGVNRIKGGSVQLN